MTHSRRLAVIIPYYQREAGILRRALDSIAAQDLPEGISIEVLVIDDSSPLLAEAEMRDFPVPAWMKLKSHRQANGGPGAARNTALDMVAQDGGFDFVAFLDSDDEWSANHLRDAIAALDRGYDFYFCDNGRDGTHNKYSEGIPLLAAEGASIRHKSDWYDATKGGGQMGFPPHSLTLEFLSSYLCQTSTVVTKAKQLSDCRFDPELRVAGEDHMFWITLVSRGARVLISWANNVACGRGVNIYFGAFDWNKPETLNRIGSLLILHEKLLNLDSLPPESACINKNLRRRYRRAYGYLIFRAIFKRISWRSETLNRVRRLDPLFPYRIPFLALSLAFDRDPAARRF